MLIQCLRCISLPDCTLSVGLVHHRTCVYLGCILLSLKAATQLITLQLKLITLCHSISHLMLHILKLYLYSTAHVPGLRARLQAAKCCLVTALDTANVYTGCCSEDTQLPADADTEATSHHYQSCQHAAGTSCAPRCGCCCQCRSCRGGCCTGVGSLSRGMKAPTGGFKTINIGRLACRAS